MKNSNETIGNQTITFQLVAQRLKQLRHRVHLLQCNKYSYRRGCSLYGYVKINNFEIK